MHPVIASLQNQKIKNVVALEKPKERKRQNLLVVEGLKEVPLAISASYAFETVYFCPDIIAAEDVLALVKNERLLVPVTHAVYEKISYRETTGGVIGIARQKTHPLEGIKTGGNPLILVVESVEKPGNLGALLRTADAANLDAVIICDPNTDFYNPNVIRSSLGCVFTQQVASATSAEAILWLRENNLKIFCTSLQASRPYHQVDFTTPCAIVMGTEATGLSSTWTDASDANIIIPMQGSIDSMNVSTAAAVVIFEAKRQRKFQ
jgi:RNA methyltransferase, TrmH family